MDLHLRWGVGCGMAAAIVMFLLGGFTWVILPAFVAAFGLMTLASVLIELAFERIFKNWE